MMERLLNILEDIRELNFGDCCRRDSSRLFCGKGLYMRFSNLQYEVSCFFSLQ